LPSSHSDAAYDELLEIARDIKTGAGRLTEKAANFLIKDISHGTGDNYSFVIFNPLNWDVENIKLTGVIRLGEDIGEPGGYILDTSGAKYQVLSVKQAENHSGTAYLVEFTGDLPALGYNIFKFIPEIPVLRKTINSNYIENNRFKIEFDRYGIKAIFDKKLNRIIASDAVCTPYLEEDCGHLWGGLMRSYAERVDKPFTCHLMTPSRAHEIKTEISEGSFGQRAVVTMIYNRKELRLEKLEWKMTVNITIGIMMEMRHGF